MLAPEQAEQLLEQLPHEVFALTVHAAWVYVPLEQEEQAVQLVCADDEV